MVIVFSVTMVTIALENNKNLKFWYVNMLHIVILYILFINYVLTWFSLFLTVMNSFSFDLNVLFFKEILK